MSEKTYNRILKSTTIIGGSSIVNVLIKVVQSKIVALLIGPSGVGLMGLFNSVLSLSSTISGMGLTTSGVREIALANETGNEDKIRKTITAFNILAWIFGILGALILYFSRKFISQVTFGTDQHAFEIGILSIALFLTVISSSQFTLLRGMSHVHDLARINIYSVILGTVFGIPIIYFWRVDGVVAFVMLTAITSFVFSWFYARNLQVKKTQLPLRTFIGKSRSLLTLGVGFMVAGLTTTASTYLIKLMISRQLGLDATGLFEASSQLSNVYVGFILGAMGTDFFPHLSAVVRDKEKSTQLINAQVRIGLFSAAPGILAVLAAGPILISLLYSGEFFGAYDILRWQAMATFIRVISWPLGFLILSKGKIGLLITLELSTNIIYLISAWLGMSIWEIDGIGIAFLLKNIYHISINTIFARKIIAFKWTRENIHLAGFIFLIMLLAFVNSFFVSNWWSIALGLALTIGMGVFSIRRIKDLVGKEFITIYLVKIKKLLRFGRDN